MNKELFNMLFRGYLPKELPPTFNSYDFAVQIDKVRYALADKFQTCISAPSVLSIPKNGIGRRILSIINPYSFYHLAAFLCSDDTYAMLNNICKASTVTYSRPKRCNTIDRRAIIPNCKSVSDFHTIKLLKSLYKRIELKIDISSFYSTIYTHAITWMCIGKDKAKEIWRGRISNPGYSCGDPDIDRRYNIAHQIDTLVEYCQDKQTHGLPVGPDTSFLLAETLLCHIDSNIDKALSRIPGAPKYQGCRYYDDWFLYVETKDEADLLLRVVIQELEKFGLDVNLSKVEINEMPVAVLDDFTDRLSSFDFHNASNIERIKVFFEALWSLIRNDRNRAATYIRYAMRVLNGFLTPVVVNHMATDNKNLILIMLYRTVADFPDCIPAILPVAQKLGNNIDKGILRDLIGSILQRHVDLGHHIEVAWALWMCKIYNIEIPADWAVRILSAGNSICSLLLLDYLNNINTDLLTNKGVSDAITALTGKLSKSSLYGQDWLLLYEGVLKGWLRGLDNLVDNDPFFSMLKRLEVSFYNMDPEVDYQSPSWLLKNAIQLPKHLKDEIERQIKTVNDAISLAVDEQYRASGVRTSGRVDASVKAISQKAFNEIMLTILTGDDVDTDTLSKKYSRLVRSVRVS